MSVHFIQASGDGQKKHNCTDCHFCQFCSDTRCNSCRSCRSTKPHLTMAEQILHFNRLNEDDPVRPDQPLRIDL